MHTSHLLSLLSLFLLTALILGAPVPIPADEDPELDDYGFADETDAPRGGLGYQGNGGNPGIGAATNRPANGNAQVAPTQDLQPGLESGADSINPKTPNNQEGSTAGGSSDDDANSAVPGGAGAADGAADPGPGGHHGSGGGIGAGGDRGD